MKRLRQVSWIGGSPCSGKSTVARLLAAAHGAALYSCDDAFERHAAAITAAQGPTLKKVTTWSAAQRLAQPVEVQVADSMELYREEFPLITQDLTALPVPLVVEGAALLPELLAGLRVPVERAVWIVPTVEFQVAHYTQRTWARELVQDTSARNEAFRRWMQRDTRFAAAVADQARALGYHVVVTDGSRSPQNTAEEICTLFDPLTR